MPEISVLTALFNPNLQYLQDSYGDLQGQTADWEWIIQWDGPATCDLPEEIAGDPRVHIHEGDRQWGIAITRNRALMRASAEILYVHDYDDRIMPGTLSAIVEVLLDRPDLVYTCGHWDDLVQDEDGAWRVVEFPDHGIGPGLLEPGWKPQRRSESGRAIAPPPSSYGLRRVYVDAYGGWGALSSGEDNHLISALRSQHPGWYLPGTLGLYRKHSRSMTANASEAELYEQHTSFVERRIKALETISGLADKTRS